MKIHLSPQVKALLMELKAMGNYRYILSSIKANTPLTENALPRAIKRIEDRIGIASWTAHDLRRTFATQLGEALHVDPVVIEKCLVSWQRIIKTKCCLNVKKHWIGGQHL